MVKYDYSLAKIHSIRNIYIYLTTKQEQAIVL